MGFDSLGSGDRSEFTVSRSQYGILVENDTRLLIFQGTRYLTFEREIKTAT